MHRRHGLIIIGALALASACAKGSTKDGFDTAVAKSPRVVGTAGCTSLPNASDVAKYLKAAPDSGEAGGLFTARQSGRPS